MTYNGLQYCLNRNLKGDNVSTWLCRRGRTLKCHGYIYLCNKTTRVIKEVPHNDKDHSERLKASTMGTDDTSIRYSKSKVKTTVLHFCGYQYLMQRCCIDGKIRWQCRYVRQKRCKG